MTRRMTQEDALEQAVEALLIVERRDHVNRSPAIEVIRTMLSAIYNRRARARHTGAPA